MSDMTLRDWRFNSKGTKRSSWDLSNQGSSSWLQVKEGYYGRPEPDVFDGDQHSQLIPDLPAPARTQTLPYRDIRGQQRTERCHWTLAVPWSIERSHQVPLHWGVNFKISVGDSVDNVPVIAVKGVTHNKFKTVLVLQSGDKESASIWREFFKDLKQRGLNTNHVRLGVMSDCRVWKQSSKKNLLIPGLNDARSM